MASSIRKTCESLFGIGHEPELGLNNLNITRTSPNENNLQQKTPAVKMIVGIQAHFAKIIEQQLEPICVTITRLSTHASNVQDTDAKPTIRYKPATQQFVFEELRSITQKIILVQTTIKYTKDAFNEASSKPKSLCMDYQVIMALQACITKLQGKMAQANDTLTLFTLSTANIQYYGPGITQEAAKVQEGNLTTLIRLTVIFESDIHQAIIASSVIK